MNDDETLPLAEPGPEQILREALQAILVVCSLQESMRLRHIADLARTALKRAAKK